MIRQKKREKMRKLLMDVKANEVRKSSPCEKENSLDKPGYDRFISPGRQLAQEGQL